MTGVIVCSARAARLAACLAVAGLAGCALIDPFPDSPDEDKARSAVSTGAERGSPDATFEAAIDYARNAQANYRTWLIHQDQTNLWLGTGALAMAGAALGLGTVGGQTAAVAATGTAGGALVALDQWIIGTPSKDPRYKAYTSGMSQLQCVIDDAWAEKPRIFVLTDKSPTKAEEPPKPMDASKTLGELWSQQKRLERANDTLSATAARSICSSSPDLRAARLVGAEALADQHRAQAVALALANAPREIVAAVHTVDQNAFAQAQAGIPDISSLPKVSSIAGKAPSKGAAPAFTAQESKEKTKPACPIPAAIETVTSLAKTLEASLAGVKIAQQGFAECIKPPPSPTDGSGKDQQASTPSKPSPPAALKVLPSSDFLIAPKSSQGLSISGGHPPYDLIIVDRGLEVSEKTDSGGAAGASGAAELQLKVEGPGDATEEPRRLLITDQAGAQIIVQVQTGQPARP